jgi:opacity protein-like surface antigen
MKKLLILALIISFQLSSAKTFSEIFYEKNPKLESKLYATYQFSLNNPIGLKVGMLNWKDRFGAYIGIYQSDFSFSLNSDVKSDDATYFKNLESNGKSYYSDKDEENKTSYMFVLGGNYCLSSNLQLYIGVGYGVCEKSYQLNIGSGNKDNFTKEEEKWIEDVDHNEAGVASEYGVLFNFDNFILSVGASNINFKKTDLQVGIGYKF